MNHTEYLLSLPHNSKKTKWAFVSLLITLILCVLGIVISKHFWEGNTTWVYSLKYQRNIEIGWPVSLNSWSWYLGVSIIIILPFLYFMQDWKNPSIALTKDSLFINQQMMRNIFIPYGDIRQIIKENDSYDIVLTNNEVVLRQINFLFKPFIKSNLSHQKINISSMYTSGNLIDLFNDLENKIANK